MASSIHPEQVNVYNFAGRLTLECQSVRITYEFVFSSLALTKMSYLYFMDVLWDGWLVVEQLMFCMVLIQGFVQNST